MHGPMNIKLLTLIHDARTREYQHEFLFPFIYVLLFNPYPANVEKIVSS